MIYNFYNYNSIIYVCMYEFPILSQLINQSVKVFYYIYHFLMEGKFPTLFLE